MEKFITKISSKLNTDIQLTVPELRTDQESSKDSIFGSALKQKIFGAAFKLGGQGVLGGPGSLGNRG